MFKSTVVLALALLSSSAVQGKRILRGAKKEQRKTKEFRILAKEGNEQRVRHLTPGQVPTAEGVRRLFEAQKNDRDLRGSNGGGKSGKSSGESDVPQFIVHIDDDDSVLSLVGMSGEVVRFAPLLAYDDDVSAMCSDVQCSGELQAVVEGYECDIDNDEFEDVCLDVAIEEDWDMDFFCPLSTQVMRIVEGECFCTGQPATGACTPDLTLSYENPGWRTTNPATNTCVDSYVVTYTLVCESLIADSTSTGKSKSRR